MSSWGGRWCRCSPSASSTCFLLSGQGPPLVQCLYFSLHTHLNPLNNIVFPPKVVKYLFFFKKMGTLSWFTLGTGSRIITNSGQFMLYYERGLQIQRPNSQWKHFNVICDYRSRGLKYLTFQRQRHKLSAPTVLIDCHFEQPHLILYVGRPFVFCCIGRILHSILQLHDFFFAQFF